MYYVFIYILCKKYNLAIFSYIEYLKQKRFHSIIAAFFVTFYSMHKYFQEIYGIKNLNGMTSHEYKNKLAKIICVASLANKPCHKKRHSQKFAFQCPNKYNLTLLFTSTNIPLGSNKHGLLRHLIRIICSEYINHITYSVK